MRNVPDDVELQLRERAAHLVELVLGLGDDLVESVIDRPDFLLFGQRSEMTLPAPVRAGAADPLIQNTSILELNDVGKLLDEIGELGIRFLSAELVSHLERHWHDGSTIIGQRRFRHQDLMVAILQALHDLRGVLLPREIKKVFLDVLDLEGALLKPVLLDEVFVHKPSIISVTGGCSEDLGTPAPYSARSATIGSTRVARRAGT